MSFPFTQTLPALGASETDTLEFKSALKPRDRDKNADRFECAKDVAALANAAGGTLLVGARHSGGQLLRYEPVDGGTAAWIEREYEEAVRDRCAPPPSIRTTRIPCDDKTKIVVAIHVPPFPSPVAVKVRGDRKDGYGADAWVFFARVATRNRAFRPEVLPMLTPEVRRITIILRSIGPDDDVRLATNPTLDGRHYGHQNCRLKSIDETGNSVTFTLTRPAGATESPDPNICVPLDQIITAYRADGLWIVDSKK